MRLVVVGGDRRETEAAAHLAAFGHEVTRVGAPDAPEAAPGPYRALFVGADAVVGPALGTTAAGDAFFRAGPRGPLPIDPDWLRACAPATPWLVGRAGPWLAAAAGEWGLTLHTYADRDEFALRNAIPTAEGAIAEASRLSGRAAWGTPAMVVGGGRCARALVSRLHALGAAVCCVARSPGARAEAEALGVAAAPWPHLAEAASRATWVFNTVPAPVVTRAVLSALARGAVVVDIASAPGGTDMGAAADLGIEAALVLGIPGRMFPVTAGQIVARTVLEVLGVAVPGTGAGPRGGGG